MEKLIAETKKKIEILRKNRIAVPLETLKSKYAKAYNKLVDDISGSSETILKHYSYEGVRVKVDDLERMVDKFEQLAIDCGISKKLSRLVFKEYNLAAAIDEAKRYRKEKVEPVYKEYLEELNAKQT